MARPPRYSDAEIHAAFETAGSVAGAARLLGCAQQTVRSRLRNDPRAAWEPWAAQMPPAVDEVHRGRLESMLAQLDALRCDPATPAAVVLRAIAVEGELLRAWRPPPPAPAPRAETSESALEDALDRLMSGSE